MENRQIKELARDLLAEHGFLDNGWDFAFDRCVRSVAMCRYDIQLVTLSRVHAPTLTRTGVVEVMFHEIAHVYTGWVPHDPHGEHWRSVCQELGGLGNPTLNSWHFKRTSGTAHSKNLGRAVDRQHRRT